MERKKVVDRKGKRRLDLRNLKRKGENVKKAGKAIAIWVDLETAERVTKIAKKVGISNSQLLRNVALCGLDDAEMLDKLGMLSLAMLVKKTKERLQSLAEEGRKQIVEA